MPFGFWQKVLRVNLTTRRTSIETPDETFYRRYFGSAGLAAYYLLRELPPGAQPLGADNLLVFAASVVTGAPIAGCGRNSVGALSPMTGGFGKCEVEGASRLMSLIAVASWLVCRCASEQGGRRLGRRCPCRGRVLWGGCRC